MNVDNSDEMENLLNAESALESGNISTARDIAHTLSDGSRYFIESETDLEKPRQLTNEQQLAIQNYRSLIPGSSLLLWGVTGSGKTEVYLQIAEKELSQGRHC